jgi:hypothetical protein
MWSQVFFADRCLIRCIGIYSHFSSPESQIFPSLLYWDTILTATDWHGICVVSMTGGDL